MLAGYLMADAGVTDRQENIALADGCELAPLSGIEEPAAAHLGALDHLLREIEAFCTLARKPRRASEWSDEIERLYSALFRIDTSDRETREAHGAVLRFIREIAGEPAEAGVDPQHCGDEPQCTGKAASGAIWRLSAVPERQRFLMGGVTFCGMVPRRAIPFRMIAVLGLDDGKFPRPDSDAGLDLMTRHRRLGDRDVRSDDRYLFLETVMAARERLHLSFIGEGVRDGKPRNPAIPLAELLDALGSAAPEGDALDARPGLKGLPWLIRHPLQPFDARYFDESENRDRRLFSYNETYARMRAGTDEAKLAAFYDGAGALLADVDRSVTLAGLREYFRDPSRQVLRDRMKVRLDALDDDRLREDEPLAAKLEAIDRVTQRLFFDEALRSPSWPPALAPAWLRLGGLLPPGRSGEIAWEDECDKVALLLGALREIPGMPPDALPALREEAIDLRIGDWRVAGTVARVLATIGQGGRETRHILMAPNLKSGALKPESELTFKDRVPAFLDWALLRLQCANDAHPPAVRIVLLTAARKPWQDAINAWDEHFLAQPDEKRGKLCDSLQARVLRLLEIWRIAQSRPPVYFPKTSWEVEAVADPAASSAEAVSAWFGDNRFKGERDYEPGYNALLAGEWTFAADARETGDLMRFARDLGALISLDQAEERVS